MKIITKHFTMNFFDDKNNNQCNVMIYDYNIVIIKRKEIYRMQNRSLF